MWADLQMQALRMRREPTRAEDKLWQELRGGKLDGLRFRRQHPLGRFIADFYCVKAGLIIEVDGGVHEGQQDADTERDDCLQAMGLTVLRFTNVAVLSKMPEVLDRIRRTALGSEASD